MATKKPTTVRKKAKKAPPASVVSAEAEGTPEEKPEPNVEAVESAPTPKTAEERKAEAAAAPVTDVKPEDPPPAKPTGKAKRTARKVADGTAAKAKTARMNNTGTTPQPLQGKALTKVKCVRPFRIRYGSIRIQGQPGQTFRVSEEVADFLKARKMVI
jgi:hypothetical protein